MFTMDDAIGFLMLTAMEIVLGIDNIVFIAIVTGRLPEALRPKARRLGLILALFMRVLLLLGISWLAKLTDPLFTIASQPFSGRDLILLIGGLFLIAKATFEIHHKVEGADEVRPGTAAVASFQGVLIQIMFLDIIFSLDSVITAVGMVQNISIMIAAVIVSIGVMVIFANSVSEFIERHPTMKMLALSFLILIGVVLFADGLGRHVEKGYIYFAMAFSLAVELLNIRMKVNNARKKA